MGGSVTVEPIVKADMPTAEEEEVSQNTELFEESLSELVRRSKHLYDSTSPEQRQLLQNSRKESGQWQRSVQNWFISGQSPLVVALQ